MTANRIWIVEDEAIIALDLKKRLETRGFVISGISDTGVDAIDKIRKHQPNLILMDITLKGDMDGINAGEIIRSEMMIPIIYLTAYSDEQTLERAMITQPYGYISKPFLEEELFSTITTAIREHSMREMGLTGI
ncbi:response regulator [Methanocalculus sp.]|uniref:response regulator n=1 Tax=Methanocalculus sp. TaxID=2004547 RepID=UPI00272561A2|nr:response regulator [Methanocalculus sp.]MDO8841766.1 response regulator [Methanocalculus sp.]